MGKVFRQKIAPLCVYCTRSTLLDAREFACLKKGVVDAYSHCRQFKYDPLKRIPPKPVKLKRDYSKEDFKI